MIRLVKKTLVYAAISCVLFSCKKDKDATPALNTPVLPTTYTVPTTYNFSNVNYTGQQQRIEMLDSISEYMKKSNSGQALDVNKLKNMYGNSGNPFNNSGLDGSGKKLKDKTYAADQTYFEGLMDSLANNSVFGGQTGSNGTPGIVTSPSNSSKKYLCNKDGIEYAQVTRKQMMGAIFYYQAVEVYLNKLSTADNTTVKDGQGTDMEHYCDEAFGYLGVPVDFPTNVTGVKYWGEYAIKVNDKINANSRIMNAFIKLRAAVSNKDYTTRDAQIAEIKAVWEEIVAASAIYELKAAKTTFSDDAQRNHYLSEALGFIYSLKYNSNKKISQTQIDAAANAVGTNFYNITTGDIDSSINTINGVFGFDITKF